MLFLMYRTAVDLEADARPGDQATIYSTKVQILTYLLVQKYKHWR